MADVPLGARASPRPTFRDIILDGMQAHRDGARWQDVPEWIRERSPEERAWHAGWEAGCFDQCLRRNGALYAMPDRGTVLGIKDDRQLRAYAEAMSGEATDA